MIIVNDLYKWDGAEIAATVGFFDGVHTGHRYLLRQLNDLAASEHLPSTVITFANHPRTVLDTDFHPHLLNTMDEKIQQLATTGVEYCIVLNFTKELSLLTAREFMGDFLKKQLHVSELLIGYDHRFGHDRKEGYETFAQYGAGLGIHVHLASSLKKDSRPISSSIIRNLLMEGEVQKAAQLLTYPYQIQGVVVDGHKIGRKLGFPTANIQLNHPEKIIPRRGVYEVTGFCNNQYYKGMLHIGNRPTLNNGEEITLEVHLFGFEGNLYGQEVTLFFKRFIRENIRFNSLDQLKQQLQADKTFILLDK